MKALITGASSGIGKEFARYLAELGYDLIIASRRTDKLNELKDELSGVNVRVVRIDLSNEQDAYDLYEQNFSGIKTYIPALDEAIAAKVFPKICM